MDEPIASALSADTEAKQADIERRRQEEKDNIGQKAVQRRLQDLREATSEKQIAQAIINVEKNVKAGAKITKEEQDFVNQKKQELKDKGFEIVDHTGKIFNLGLNLIVNNVKTLEENENLTKEEIEAVEKELENREKKKQRLREKGLSEQKIDNQLEDTIIIMTTVQPQLNKDGKMVQAAKVNGLQIEVSQAEEILERSKKNPKDTQKNRETKINAKYDAELQAELNAAKAIDFIFSDQPTQDIEAKKAEIERRRQEELNKLLGEPGSTQEFWSTAFKYNTYEEFKQAAISKFGDSQNVLLQLGARYKIAKDKLQPQYNNINAEYDAELARELYKEMKAGKLVTDMTVAEQAVADKYITEELRKSVDAELDALETTDETDLEELTSSEETLDVSTILNIIGDVANQESSQVGITVDDMIRDFLAFNEPQMPSYMTKNHPAYQALFGSKGIITEIRDKVLEGKWTILSDHVKVFDRSLGPKDEDGKPMGLAGEVDLIYIDNETGEIEIIDIKTAKPANWTYWDVDKEVKALEIKLENKKAELANKENAKRESFIKKDIEELEGKLVSAKRKYSKKLNYSIQQTIYRNLVYRMTGKMPRAIKILPLSVDYTKDGVINKISIPTKVTDTDAKGNPGMFITLEPVNEVEKYVPIGKIKDTIEPGNEQEYKETEVVSNQIGYNLGKSFVYNGRVGTLIKNADGTYALDTPTEIIDISINGNNKISSEATIEIVGLTPVKIIQRPFTTTTINGVEHTITELDSEDDTIIVDGVKYKVTRTAKKKTVNGVEFMSNQKEIDEIDARIRDVSKDIVKRQQDGEREGEDVNTFTKNLAEAKIELEGLNEKRATLVGTNKIRKITGTNATDILFLINQSPEIFLQNPPKDIEEENEDLEDIRSLFPSDAAFQEVYQIMKNRPEALSRLINGEYTGTEQDIEAIKDWISKSIATLSFSKNDVSTAVLMLTKLNNEVELIKLTKNGKISKRQPKGLFERQNPEGRPRLGVPNVQEPGTGSAEGVSGQSSSKKGSISPQEGKQIIDSVKKRNQRPKPTLSQTLGTLGTDENIEGYEEIRERIMKADESELDSIEKDLFMKAIRQEISLSGRAIEELIAERRFQLQENATVKDVKKNQMVVSIAPVIGFDKDSTGTDLAAGSLFKVIKVSEKSVTLQYLDNKKIKAELSAAEFNKKFKPMPKETKPKTVKKPISKEYQEVSLDVAEELDKFAQNQANIQNIQDTFGKMTEDEADNAFMNAVKQCKTK
jgi:hypothetical protein